MAFKAQFGLDWVKRWYVCVKCKHAIKVETDHTAKVNAYCPTCKRITPHFCKGRVRNETSHT